jgi:hypothetical protein
MFDWYQLVYYWTPTAEFPFDNKLIGRWIGIAENCTDEMANTILTSNATILARKSVWALTQEERRTPAILLLIKQLDEAITSKIGAQTEDNLPAPPNDLFDDGDDQNAEPSDNGKTSQEVDDITPEALDEYLTAELLLPQVGEVVKARVIKQLRDGDGIPVGKRNTNPILDTRQYEVEFPDGSLDTFAANTIAENLYSQVDAEGHPFQLFTAITNHRTDNRALSANNAMYTDKQGNNRPKLTTIGWDIQVEWADGTQTTKPSTIDVDKDVAIIAVMIITLCVTMIILHAVFVRRQNLCAAIYYW